MPTQTELGWIKEGTRVRLRDGRTIIVSDAFDQTFMVTEHTPDGERPVKIHEFDDICMGTQESGTFAVFPASEVVSIIEA